MPYNRGDLVCVISTGERVIVDSYSEPGDSYAIVRPLFSDTGIQHLNEIVPAFVLETVEQQAERQLQEMFLKSKMQLRLDDMVEALHVQPAAKTPTVN
jgi:hypothetical protein